MAEEPSSRTIVIVGQGGIQTDLDLDTLNDPEVAEVLPDLLADYSAECKDWTLIAREHWRCGRWNRAQDLLDKGVSFFGRGRQADHTALVNLHAMLAHLYLALSRSAPKTVLPNAKFDLIAKDVRTKDYYYNEATANLNQAEEAFRASGASPEEEPVSLAMGKIILYLARGQPKVAHPLVDRLLQRQPNNLAGLTARARLQFAMRQHDAALLTYQKLLQLDPEVSPDPRIGIGLCAWVIGDQVRAREAWNRSLERDPEAWAPRLLMGLGSLNLARDLSLPIAERLGFETEGVAHVQRAFKLNNRSVAASLALASVMALGRHLPEASKLAERAIQYADNKRHSVLANSERGRLGFMAGDVTDAGRFIAAAKAEDPAVNMMAELTLAQIAIKTGNLREALAFVEQTAKRIAGKGPVEFTVLHASLLAYPHLGMPADELARNRQNARTMLAGIQDAVSSAKTEKEVAELRGVRYDTDAFIELAKLWQDESVDKAITSYQTAISIKSDPDSNSDNLLDTQTESQERKPVDYANVRLSTNLAALYALQGETENAERMFQEALQTLASEDGKEADSLKTVLAFDLGRTSEQNGDAVKASQWYRDVLGQHPEHMDSKVRLASITAAAGRNADAHNYLKECLRADEHNLSLRAAYTNFLISLGSYKEALAFTSQTLKQDKHDAWTFTALGWLHFTLGREAKSPQDVAERSKQYLRSAEAYERALGLDPNNAVAAQGLAIALAEDTLLSKAQQAAQSSADDVKNRNRLAGQALAVFGRIKDSLPEGAVNVNIGHCYFIRGEEERAIEAYGAALNAFGGRKVAVLLYLCRAWYAYANKESNFSAMGQALNYAQKAMHIQPSDRAILYNIAMIQQKAAEIMLSLDPSRRMLDELHVALKHAQEAVSVFRSLADDKSGPLPYDADLADQRARYGEGLLRKAPEQIAKQEAYESETAARVEEARRLRAEEQARIEAAAAARKAEIDARAAELAEERRKAREEARQFQETLEAQQQEEEQRRLEKLEQRKRRKEDDEVVDGEEKPRRKRKGKKRKPKSDVSDDDEPSAEPSAPMSEDDGPEAQERKAKKTLAMLKARRKKSRREDPDSSGEDTGRRGKYKSKAIIEDSDEEMGDDTAGGETATAANTAAGTAAVSAAGSPVASPTEDREAASPGVSDGQSGGSRAASVSPPASPVASEGLPNGDE